MKRGWDIDTSGLVAVACCLLLVACCLLLVACCLGPGAGTGTRGQGSIPTYGVRHIGIGAVFASFPALTRSSQILFPFFPFALAEIGQLRANLMPC